MEINERIKILRKELKISQEEFGKKLNLKKSAISKYEKGINKVNDRTIINICREFKVNEEWLRFGEGKIFQEVPESTIKRLIKEYNLNDTQSKLIIEFLNLNESEREVLAASEDIKDLKKIKWKIDIINLIAFNSLSKRFLNFNDKLYL